MIYYIGGAARCGKSSLARRLRQELPLAQSLSGDAFRTALRPHITPKTYANLNMKDEAQYIDFHENYPELAIQELKQQADELQPYLHTYINSVIRESNDDLIIESVDVWPHSQKSTEAPYKSIYLLDTSTDQWQRIIEHDDENSWMKARKLTTEQMKAWAHFSARRSEHLRKLCIQHSQPYIDLAMTSFNDAQTQGLSRLIEE